MINTVQNLQHAAADYLLKPVEQARLALAVERVQQRLQLEAASQKLKIQIKRFPTNPILRRCAY